MENGRRAGLCIKHGVEWTLKENFSHFGGKSGWGPSCCVVFETVDVIYSGTLTSGEFQETCRFALIVTSSFALMSFNRICFYNIHPSILLHFSPQFSLQRKVEKEGEGEKEDHWCADTRLKHFQFDFFYFAFFFFFGREEIKSSSHAVCPRQTFGCCLRRSAVSFNRHPAKLVTTVAATPISLALQASSACFRVEGWGGVCGRFTSSVLF